MRDFKKLSVWQEAMKIVKNIYMLTKFLPKEETYGIISQIQRASVSIASNIAEGCSRSSEVDFKRFLEMSLGSAFEVETQLIVINEVFKIQQINIQDLIIDVNSLQKMLNSLITKIKSSNSSN